MGFFLAKAEHKVKTKVASVPRGNSPKTKQSAAMLNRLGCRACPLVKEGNEVHPTIPKRETDIYFLGEAPGAEEQKKGKPFIGKSGKLLRSLIPEDLKGRVVFGNVVLHRPPNNRTPEFVEIECCRNFAIAAIEKAQPKLIVGLGKVALQWVMNSTDLIGLRGRFLTVKIGKHVCYFMPTYHPSFILRNAYDDDKPLNSRFGHCLRMDIEKAIGLLDNYRKPTHITEVEAKKDIHIYTGAADSFLSFDELIKEFEYAEEAKTIALDVETYPLRPYAKDAVLLTCAISYFLENGRLHTFAFAIKHPKAGWSKKQLELILDSFSDLLGNKKITKVAHHAAFELEWLIAELGMGFFDHNSWEDTMMQAHLLDERKGQGKEDDRKPTYQSLDFLCKQHFGLPLKSLFKLNKKDMRKTDIEECLIYNGCDSKHTLLLHKIQKKFLKDEKLLDSFNLFKVRNPTVALMQRIGIDVDQKTTKKFETKLSKAIKKIESEIMGMKVIKKYIQDKGAFNPASQPDVLSVFKDYLKRSEIKVENKYSEIHQYGVPTATKKRLDEKAEPSRYAVDKNTLGKIDHPLAPAILKLRNKQKMKSTYVDEFILGSGSLIYPDGKLHTSFNTTFTTTGRLSSDDPNMQNFPKHFDKWVRAQIVPPKNHILLAVDYGQLEWCLACMSCKDKVMVKATWDGYDVHMEWAEKIAHRWPKLIGGKKFLKDKDVMKKARSRVKNKMVFPVIFGATEKSVAGYLNMPEDVTEDIFSEFWDTFTGLSKWQKDLMKGYYEVGYVENFFGRKRRYPMTRNEAINHPIQSSASEMVVDAMNRLSMLAVKTNQWHLHPVLNIHDDLTFAIPNKPDIIDDSIEIIVKEMLKLPYDFVNVPMSVDLSIGSNWENLEDIGKIWTTDIREK